MSQKTLFNKTALAVAVALVSTSAWSAGFQLNEFSSSGLGRAYSGEGAIADDAGNASRNPALIMMFDRPTFSAGAIFVDPGVDITGRSPTGASLNSDNIAPTAWVPNLHFVAPINDQFGWGASVTSNYGLATEFSDNYAAGAFGGKTDLETLNLNLSGAYRLDNHWSFGVGFDAVYAKAKIERYAGDLGKVVAGSGALPPALARQVAGIPADTQIAYLKGDEWGFGWNAGILYELDKNNRYGFTYRSEVKIDFDGDYKSSLPSAYNQILGNFGLPMGTNGSTTGGSLSLHLPEMWELSGYNKVAPQWAIHYSLTYTSWSQFQELKATNSKGDTLFYKDESFRDAYRIALGTTYYMDDNWTFRTGIAFDDSPVPADKRSISIPDQDRFWLSAGATYAFNKDASIDAGISYMHGQKVSFKEGPYEFSSEGKAWLYGMNFNYAF
ncbi:MULTISPECIES: long-chain fatty acid transporter FadL [Enterobacter]|uniref:Long-chain fatty acid transport protein n=1 Tax=Enterobacter cloacae complex sp. Mu1197 TaxID=3152302 RepID=A0AAU7FS36_9ENTR|nr:long-chain fatty acid transporter FadL [Enterobacter quasiroggenkampii]MBG0623408.1 long-chain fatty acid transporter FadL [Enterobacter roggenkampii]SAD10905.1 long-chain fatty acid transport protein [Enterobacter cloacae]MCU6306040.1 long-chain fatty acid transporter FadL [Enterobacter quasiroggenkampii]MCU6324407.1 long-chain fatty acid transporter FadL [Enterobacter quasiroggenkampii]MCU6329212.1 long-chain fatty acid transporter FadL [Enterobacter quasiroggenkampii]